MKSRLVYPLVAAIVTLLVSLSWTVTATAQDGRLQLDVLNPLAARANETVDVTIDERLIQLAAKFLSAKDPDEARVKEIVSGLKGIYVKSFTFESENQYSPADVEPIRAQLRGPGWTRLVGVTSKKEGENAEVYLMLNGDKVGGLAVLAVDPKELTVVNLIGPVDIEKLSQLDGNFGIPDLDLNLPAKKSKPE
jgi:Domain of unknown function (DUF4252)